MPAVQMGCFRDSAAHISPLSKTKPLT